MEVAINRKFIKIVSRDLLPPPPPINIDGLFANSLRFYRRYLPANARENASPIAASVRIPRYEITGQKAGDISSGKLSHTCGQNDVSRGMKIITFRRWIYIGTFAGRAGFDRTRYKVEWTFIACRTQYDRMLLVKRADITSETWSNIGRLG